MRLAACAFAASWQPDGLSAAPAFATLRSRVTDRVFLDVRVIQRYDVAVLEDAAVRGRMAFGLFGEEAPLGTRKWLEFATGRVGQFAKGGGGPSYGSSYFETLRPAVALEGGRINGLKQTQFAGQLEWEYGDKLLPLRAIPEANDLRHDRRGLLTRPLFESGPGFAVTLGPAPELDGRCARPQPGSRTRSLWRRVASLAQVGGDRRARGGRRHAEAHRGPPVHHGSQPRGAGIGAGRHLWHAEELLRWALQGDRRHARGGSHG